MLYGASSESARPRAWRLKDVDLERREFVPRETGSRRDRVSMLPEELVVPLQQQVAAVRAMQESDRARVVEVLTGVASKRGAKASELATVIKSLPKRTFVVRDASDGGVLLAVKPQQTMSFLRRAMMEGELREARSSDVTHVPPRP